MYVLISKFPLKFKLLHSLAHERMPWFEIFQWTLNPHNGFMAVSPYPCSRCAFYYIYTTPPIPCLIGLLFVASVGILSIWGWGKFCIFQGNNVETRVMRGRFEWQKKGVATVRGYLLKEEGLDCVKNQVLLLPLSFSCLPWWPLFIQHKVHMSVDSFCIILLRRWQSFVALVHEACSLYIVQILQTMRWLSLSLSSAFFQTVHNIPNLP